MVTGSSTFDSPDFILPERPAWYVRKAGWTRGPYSLDDMRRFRDLGWLSRSESVSQDMQAWRTAGQFEELWSNTVCSDTDQASPAPAASPPNLTNWRYSVDGLPCDEPASLATLQILASLGRIRESDLVWREGWPEWRVARAVPGLMAGHSEWCSGCGGAVSPRDDRCRQCGARLPGHEPAHSDSCKAIGALGLVLFPVFPLWIIAMVLGRYDLSEISKGSMDPGGRDSARFAVRAGVTGGGLFLAGLIAAVALWVVNR